MGKRVVLLAIVMIVLILGCTQENTPEETNDQDTTDNQNTLTGTAQASAFARCTRIACPEDNPCCNDCQADLELTIEDTTYHVAEGTCTGNECTLTCTPLENGKTYKVEGEITDNTITLTSYEEQ